MQTLIALLLSLAFTMHTPRTGGVEESPQDRASRITEVMADIAHHAHKTPIYRGPRAVEATALTLLVIARHEGALWAEVQDCSLCPIGGMYCDHGRSITLYQIQSTGWGPYTRDQLCSDNRLATERAVAILKRYARASTTLQMFDGYARGRITKDPCKAAHEMESMLRRALAEHGITITWKHGALTAR